MVSIIVYSKCLLLVLVCLPASSATSQDTCIIDQLASCWLCFSGQQVGGKNLYIHQHTKCTNSLTDRSWLGRLFFEPIMMTQSCGRWSLNLSCPSCALHHCSIPFHSTFRILQCTHFRMISQIYIPLQLYPLFFCACPWNTNLVTYSCNFYVSQPSSLLHTCLEAFSMFFHCKLPFESLQYGR